MEVDRITRRCGRNDGIDDYLGIVGVSVSMRFIDPFTACRYRAFWYSTSCAYSWAGVEEKLDKMDLPFWVIERDVNIAALLSDDEPLFRV